MGTHRFAQFSGWLAASTLLSSCQSVLSTEAMLRVLLHNTAETQIVNFVGRDVLGQLGSLVVMMGLAKHIDRRPQEFLMFSHLLQQTSMACVLLTPMLPSSWFLPVAAVGNVCANVSFIGFGSINAKCIQALSKDNIGELYSKVTMHSTLASTVGLSLGMLLTKSALSPEVSFAVLGVARVFTYHKAVKKVL
jgi:hypothetical protein